MNIPRDPPSRIDRSLKVLIRRAYPAFFRLARLDVDPSTIYSDDVTVILPEHRADQVFLVGAAGDPNRWGLHLEYQLQPDRRRMPGWLLKNAALDNYCCVYSPTGLASCLGLSWRTSSRRTTPSVCNWRTAPSRFNHWRS